MTVTECVPVGTVDGANRVFRLAASGEGLALFLNGLFQTPGLNFTLGTDGSTVTYTVAPAMGDTHYAQIFN